MRLPRFYPILDTSRFAGQPDALIAAARGLLDAGVSLLQFRHKGSFSRAVFEQAGTVAGLCRTAAARLVMNDRADLASLLNADLHLGQDDLTPAEARLITGQGTCIGLSTHNAPQLEACRHEPVDYVALGPIFATGSKLRPDPVVGLEQLADWRRLTERPLVAIGGITIESALSVLRAGADSVAVISGWMRTPYTSSAIRASGEQWMRALGE